MKNSKFTIQNSELPRYAEYKDSGVEWLGDVPEHWNVLPGRVTLSLNKVKNTGNVENTVLSLSYGRLVIKPPEKLTGLVPESFEGYQIINPGDIIIRPTDLQNDWTSLRVGLAKDRGIITSAYLGLKHDEKVSSEYLYYLLHSYDLLKVYYGMGTGLRQNLSWDDFKYLPLTFPPKPEQDCIVAFLDRKTAEIDTLIAKKKRQIELLDEQKAILINLAVTRGIVNSEFGIRNDSLSSSSHSTFTTHNSKFVPSGIEWIGGIPEHWVTAPLYSRCDVRLGKMLDAAKIKGRHLQPYLRNTDVQWFEINSSDLPRMDFRPEEYERYSVKRGDLVVCEGGEPGRAALWDSDEPCFFQKALHRVRPLKGDIPQFLLYLFSNAVTMSAFSGFDKSTIAHLTGEQLRRFRFAFSPPHEQTLIANYCSELMQGVQSVQARIRDQIQSLQTLRSTLIAHAVTGRIKV